jgi:hypothetical protein
VLNSCAPFNRLTTLAYQRRLQDLYYIKSCEPMADKADELFTIMLANFFVPSEDFETRMVELGVCPTLSCDSYEARKIAHYSLPIFAKLEAMIVAGCNLIFQSAGEGGGTPGEGTSYPIKAVTYTSDSDDNDTFVVAAVVGKRVIALIRALSPLQDNQWIFTTGTGTFNLVNGAVALSDGESVTIIYEDIP